MSHPLPTRWWGEAARSPHHRQDHRTPGALRCQIRPGCAPVVHHAFLHHWNQQLAVNNASANRGSCLVPVADVVYNAFRNRTEAG